MISMLLIVTAARADESPVRGTYSMEVADAATGQHFDANDGPGHDLASHVIWQRMVWRFEPHAITLSIRTLSLNGTVFLPCEASVTLETPWVSDGFDLPLRVSVSGRSAAPAADPHPFTCSASMEKGHWKVAKNRDGTLTMQWAGSTFHLAPTDETANWAAYQARYEQRLEACLDDRQTRAFQFCKRDILPEGKQRPTAMPTSECMTRWKETARKECAVEATKE